jgi:hypothetical protein
MILYIEVLGGPQITIPLLDAGVEAGGFDRDLDRPLRKIHGIVNNRSEKFIETAPDFREAHERHGKFDGRVHAIDAEAYGFTFPHGIILCVRRAQKSSVYVPEHQAANYHELKPAV